MSSVIHALFGSRRYSSVAGALVFLGAVIWIAFSNLLVDVFAITIGIGIITAVLFLWALYLWFVGFSRQKTLYFAMATDRVSLFIAGLIYFVLCLYILMYYYYHYLVPESPFSKGGGIYSILAGIGMLISVLFGPFPWANATTLPLKAMLNLYGIEEIGKHILQVQKGSPLGMLEEVKAEGKKAGSIHRKVSVEDLDKIFLHRPEPNEIIEILKKSGLRYVAIPLEHLHLEFEEESYRNKVS